MIREAYISEDKKYRYWLEREWDRGGRKCVFIMLNPSTADGKKDDPTIRKCVGFARRWSCIGLTVVNMYALRSTSPKALKDGFDPIGPENKLWVGRSVLQAINRDSPVVCAWGRHGRAGQALLRQWMSEWYPKAGGSVLSHLHSIGQPNNDGTPMHPLMAAYERSLIPYSLGT